MQDHIKVTCTSEEVINPNVDSLMHYELSDLEKMHPLLE